MFKFVSLALVALGAISAVNAVAIFPRKTPPSGWIAEILEPYDEYNARYLAIGCRDQHNTQFFDDCCHPMKKGETLEKNRKPYCSPGSSSSVGPNSSPAPEPTSVPDDDDNSDNDDGDDDCEDEPDYSSTPVPTPEPTPKPSPSTSTSSTKPPADVKPSTTKDSDPAPSPTPTKTPSSETHTGGHVTWFTQNGNAGACGDKHSDNDFIAALDSRVYGNTGAKSKYCGEQIKVSWQGKSVIVTVADACPTCDNDASVDLSLAAFKALAPLDVGLLTDVTWELV